MRRLYITILLCLALTIAQADFLGIYDDGIENSDDSVWVYISMWDSLALKFEQPDTLFIYRYMPCGEILTADTITSLTGLNYGGGYYMKRYWAGGDIGQYTVHILGTGGGNYYSMADHNYLVIETPINELSANSIGDVADSSRQLVWKTMLAPGYPSNGDTASALLYRIHSYVDGNGAGGIDYDIEQLNDIDSVGVYLAMLSVFMTDSATVDTGAGSFAHCAIKSGSIPDSLLEAVTDIDSIRAWVGSPYHSSFIPSLHMKIGLGYSGASGDGNIKDQLDTVRIYLGKDGASLPNYTSLHDKLGAYAGISGVGNNVKDDLAAFVLNGGGTEPETLFVFSLEDTSRIQGARVNVRSVDQTTLIASGLHTSYDGKLLLALNPDSYWVELNAYGFNQVFDTLIVSDGGGTDSLFMARFDPGEPPDPGLCRVYGWVYDIAGDSLADIEVTAEIPREYHPVKYDRLIITPFCKSTQTDSTGYWQLDIIPSTEFSREDALYLFTVKNSEGVIYRAKTEVPKCPSWQLQ